MTVETTIRKENFAGGQSALTFTFRALVDHPEYIKVKETVIATGVETTLTYNTHYTVTINTNGIGGTVHVSPTYSTSYIQTVYRETSALQEADYDDYNQFPADTLEESLDRVTLIAQEQSEETDRVIQYNITYTGSTITLPAPSADTYLGWNAGATALENKELPDPSTLVKATNSEAQAATNDTAFMTPAKVKTEVEYSGAVTIPSANLNLNAVTNATITNLTVTNLTCSTGRITTFSSTTSTLTNVTAGTINITTLKVGTTNQGDILYDNGTSLIRLPPGTSGQFLKTLGTGANPVWGDITQRLYYFEPDPHCVLAFNIGTTELSPYRNTVTLTNLTSADYISGKVSRYAYDYDGSTEKATLSLSGVSSDIASSMSAITIEAWIYTTTVSGSHIFFSNLSSAVQVGINGSNLLCSIATSSGTESFSGAHGMSINTWYHFVLIWDNTGAGKIYINGALISTGDDAGNGTTSITSPLIGVYSDGSSSYWSGYLDGIRLLSRKMSTTEISSRYSYFS